MFKNKTGNVRINAILRRVRLTIFTVEKQLSIKYSECVSVALVIQHTVRKLHIILSSVACPALPCFSTLYHTERFSGGGVYGK